jgi:Flp pilus assembly protein TadD
VAKAQAAALDAMRCDRGAIDAKIILGWCHLSQKHWGDAAQQLDEAARARPDDANVHAALGYALDKLGRHQEAVAEFDRAIAVAPTKHDTHAYRGAALEAVGEVEKARAAYETAAKGGGSQPVIAAQLKLAVAAYKEKRWADARKLSEGVVAADPKNAQGRYVLGLSAFALGDRKTAGEQEYQLTLIDQARAAELRKLISKE